MTQHMSLIAIAVLLLAAPTLTGCDDAGRLVAGEDSFYEKTPPAVINWDGQMTGPNPCNMSGRTTMPPWNHMWQLIGQIPPLPDLPDGWMAVGIFLASAPTTAIALRFQKVIDAWARACRTR